MGDDRFTCPVFRPFRRRLGRQLTPKYRSNVTDLLRTQTRISSLITQSEVNSKFSDKFLDFNTTNVFYNRCILLTHAVLTLPLLNDMHLLPRHHLHDFYFHKFFNVVLQIFMVCIFCIFFRLSSIFSSSWNLSFWAKDSLFLWSVSSHPRHLK